MATREAGNFRPPLEPLLRDDGVVLLGNVEVGTKSNKTYDLLLKTMARLPGDFGVGSLDKINFRSWHSETLVAATTLHKVTEDRNDLRRIQRIKINTHLLKYLSEEAAIGVIAHELAHAWLNEHIKPEDSEEREREANALVRKWGFDYEQKALENETESVSSGHDHMTD